MRRRFGHLSFAWWIAGVACVPFIPTPLSALNPAYQISQYVHTSWRNDAGVQAVRRLKQTPDGYLWLATRTGLLRFDGVRFSAFKAGAEEGLESSTMQDLVVDPDGSIWIATLGGGLSHYVAGKFHTYTVKDGLPADDINSLYRDSRGTLWVGTRGGGIARMVGGQFEKVALAIPPSSPISAFAEGPDDSLWFSTARSGVFRLQKNVTLTSFTVKDGLPDNRVTALYRDRSGIIWTAGWKGISSWNGTRFVGYTALNRVVSYAISCTQDRDGNFWVASSSGVYRAHGGEVTRMGRSQGLSGDFVSDVFEDREGNLWAGTRGGLDRLRDGPIRIFADPQGNGHPIVAGNRSVWTVSNRQVSQFAANAIRAWPNSLPTGSTPISLLARSDANFLIGFDHGVISWTSAHSDSVTELSGVDVRSLLQAHDGSIWIGTANRGLLRWKPSAGERTVMQTGVPDKLISTLAEDRTGAMWAGSNNGAGLYRLTGGRVQHFGSDEGFRSSDVYTLFVDGRGELWIGSTIGLSWFQDGRIRTANSQQGLPADQVFAILDDSYDRLWVLGFGGVAAIDKKSLMEWASGRRSKLNPIVYRNSGGVQLRGTDTVFPNAVRSTDGHLWFSTADGFLEVIVADPATRKATHVPVLLEDVIIDRISHAATGAIRIPPGSRSIEIRYTALTLSDPEAVRFRYRLEGFDDGWVDADTRRVAFYNNLKPGDYKFRVAASADGERWQEASTLAVDQLPYFYQTNWFLTLVSAAGFSLVYFLYRLRLQQTVNRVQAAFQERMQERTRIARDLHDTLLQSFQGTMMKFGALSYLLPDHSEAKEKLESCIEQARAAVAECRDAVQGLRSSTVVSNDLARAITTFAGGLAADQPEQTRPEFRVHVEGKSRDLPPLVRDEVYRIACESLRNSFRHSRARRIEVGFWYDSRQFRLRVVDNGIGIDPAVLSVGGRAGHHGLPGISERAQLAGGKISVWSQHNSGTEIELAIPAAIAYLKSSPRGMVGVAGKEKMNHRAERQ
ncbi:MAG TPA: two-component regulator propeller domain-containing protein [Candidatus Acidoferrales bacterium]|nr:two-component regulator propeller domain-containing protein [Candidatus Acidoferrales bacterium]